MPTSSRTGTREYLANKQASRILEAARTVFMREGLSAFSARRVAKAAGLSLGSVQHVFPTTDLLIAAMIEHVWETYDAAYRRMEQRLPFSAEARLQGVIEYLLADICKEDTRNFFYGFWTLSCHDKNANRALNEIYGWQLKHVAGLIAAARPSLSDKRILEMARHVNALIDGTMLFVGMAQRAGQSHVALINALREQIWFMLDGCDPESPSKLKKNASGKSRRVGSKHG